MRRSEEKLVRAADQWVARVLGPVVELHEDSRVRERLDRLPRLDADSRDAGRRRDEQVAMRAGNHRRLHDPAVLPPLAPNDADLKHTANVVYIRTTYLYIHECRHISTENLKSLLYVFAKHTRK